jgi:hypothetical protein
MSDSRHLTTLYASTAFYVDSFTFVYVNDVRSSQEPHLWTCAALFLYVDDIRTSQKTHLWASTACYVDSFIFVYVNDVRTSQEAPL